MQSMSEDMDAFDVERQFLGDLLTMTGDRLAAIQRSIDPDMPDEIDFFAPMEYMAGIAVVAAQRYLSSICNWLSIKKDGAMSSGPKKKGVAIAEIINAAANYWK